MSTDGHRILNSLSVSTPVQLLLSDHCIYDNQLDFNPTKWCRCH